MSRPPIDPGETRALGRTGVRVTRLGFGGAPLGSEGQKKKEWKVGSHGGFLLFDTILVPTLRVGTHVFDALRRGESATRAKLHPGSQ